MKELGTALRALGQHPTEAQVADWIATFEAEGMYALICVMQTCTYYVAIKQIVRLWYTKTTFTNTQMIYTSIDQYTTW